MTFAAAYSQERNEQWTDVWPAVKHTMWIGDNVLIHCIKGRHRGAYLGVLSRALLAGESIEEANIENRRETELHKVIKDQGIKKWLNKAFQDTAMGTQHPEPQGYMQPQSDPALMCWSRMASLCASISRPTGRLSALWTRTPLPMSSRRWHGSDPGATNVSAEHLPRGGHRPRSDQPNFWPLRYFSSTGPFRRRRAEFNSSGLG